MTNKYLITQKDIKLYRPAATLDNSRIEPFILEAQEQDLKPVLNAALYLDFIKAYDNSESPDYTKYRELLNGKEYTVKGYTVEFPGIIPMLVYYTLERFCKFQPINITRFNIVQNFEQEGSQQASTSLVKMALDEIRSCAINYQNQVIEFLEANTSTYPLYRYNRSNSVATKHALRMHRG